MKILTEFLKKIGPVAAKKLQYKYFYLLIMIFSELQENTK